MGCPNLVQEDLDYIWIYTKSEEPMVRFSGPTWTNTHCLIMLRARHSYFKHKHVSRRTMSYDVQGDFWALSVETLVFPSPTGYMLTTFGSSLLNWGIFYRFIYIDWEFSGSLRIWTRIFFLSSSGQLSMFIDEKRWRKFVSFIYYYLRDTLHLRQAVEIDDSEASGICSRIQDLLSPAFINLVARHK